MPFFKVQIRFVVLISFQLFQRVSLQRYWRFFSFPTQTVWNLCICCSITQIFCNAVSWICWGRDTAKMICRSIARGNSERIRKARKDTWNGCLTFLLDNFTVFYQLFQQRPASSIFSSSLQSFVTLRTDFQKTLILFPNYFLPPFIRCADFEFAFSFCCSKLMIPIHFLRITIKNSREADHSLSVLWIACSTLTVSSNILLSF